MSLNYHKINHPYVCGVDLHSKMIYICIVDKDKNVIIHQPLKNRDTDKFKKILSPYIGQIVVAAEACFPYYWLADFCKEIGVEFALGHALYMRHIHGGKAKNDRIDSKKIALLTINQMLPYAYSYPTEKAHLRDLLRRRLHFTHKRSELKTHVKIQGYQVNAQIIGKITKTKLKEKTIVSNFENPDQRISVQMNLDTIDHYNNSISNIENYVLSRLKAINPKYYSILTSIEGVGPVIAMTIILEIDNISRFRTHKQFASYCRLIKCSHESAGKKLGFGGSKIGNPHLRNIFGQAAALIPTKNPRIKSLKDKLESKYGKAKALSILAHKLGRTVYYMLKNERVFDIDKFLSNS